MLPILGTVQSEFAAIATGAATSSGYQAESLHGRDSLRLVTAMTIWHQPDDARSITRPSGVRFPLDGLSSVLHSPAGTGHTAAENDDFVLGVFDADATELVRPLGGAVA